MSRLDAVRCGGTLSSGFSNCSGPIDTAVHVLSYLKGRQQQGATDTSEAQKRLKVAEKEYSAAEVKSANMEAMLSGLKKRHEAVKAQVATLQEQAAAAAAAAPARDGAVAAAKVDANAPGQPSSPAIQHAQAEPAIVLFVSKYEDDKAEVERISGILERAHVR